LKIQQGLDGNKAREIIQAIKSQGFKVQSQVQDQQIRVTGKKKHDLQAVIQFVRSRDFVVATNFKNSATDLFLQAEAESFFFAVCTPENYPRRRAALLKIR